MLPKGKLTVADVVQEGSLKLRLVAGARGLGAEVRGIHISEMADPTPWLSAGDLLLTTGLAFRNNAEQQVEFVRRLSQAGMVGLGVAVDIYVREPSDAMRAEADRAGFPLFEVPFEISFRSITSLVFNSIHSTDFFSLRRSLSVQDRLLSLLLEDKGLDYLVSSAAMLLSASVVVFDSLGEVVAQAPARTKITPRLLELVWQTYVDQGVMGERRVGGIPVNSHMVLLEEVRFGGRVQQILCFLYPRGEHISEMARLVVEYVRKLLSLELHRSRDEVLLQMRMSARLLDDLLEGSGRPNELRERLSKFGFVPGVPLSLFVCDVGASVAVAEEETGMEAEERLDQLRASSKEKVDAFFSDLRGPFLSAAHRDSMVVLAQSAAGGSLSLREIGDRLLAHLEGQDPSPVVTIGIGESYSDVEDVPRAFTQALEAKDARGGAGGVSARPRQGRVRLFSDLGPRVRSLENQSLERLEYFVNMTLGPVIVHDAKRGEHLLDTLQTYLVCDRDVTVAAGRLYLHPNTLRNRLRKIEHLLGISLESTDALVDVALGFESLKLVDRRAVDLERQDQRLGI